MTKEMLLCLPLMTPRLAEKVMTYRREKNFSHLLDFRKLTGDDVYQESKRYLTVDFRVSPYFYIRSIGVANDTYTHGIELWVKLDPEFDKNYQILSRKDILTDAPF